MEISDIRIRKIMHEGKLRGIVSITIDDVLAVHDIKIIKSEPADGSEGRLFVAMPSRRGEPSEHSPQLYRDIVHPIDSDTRRRLEDCILDAYRKELQKQPSDA